MGRKTLLSLEQWKDLSKRIIRIAQTVYPITLTILRISEVTKQYSKFICEAKRNGWSCLGTKLVILRRNPMIPSREVQYVDSGRAQKLSRFTVNDYFEKL